MSQNLRLYLDQSLFGIVTAPGPAESYQVELLNHLLEHLGSQISFGATPAGLIEALGFSLPVIPQTALPAYQSPLSIEAFQAAFQHLRSFYLEKVVTVDAIEQRGELFLHRVRQSELAPHWPFHGVYAGMLNEPSLRKGLAGTLAWDYLSSRRFLKDPAQDFGPPCAYFLHALHTADTLSAYRLADTLFDVLFRADFRERGHPLVRRPFKPKGPGGKKGSDLLDSDLIHLALLGPFAQGAVADTERAIVMTCENPINFTHRLRVALQFFDWLFWTAKNDSIFGSVKFRFNFGEVHFFRTARDGGAFLETLQVGPLLIEEVKQFDPAVAKRLAFYLDRAES